MVKQVDVEASTEQAQSSIFDLSSPGLLVIAGAMLTVLIVAAVATWLPARTASRAEPCELLRR